MKPLLQSIVERKLSVVQTDPPDDTIRLYCIREVLQEILLYSLCNAGFFHFAALRGDTSLRLFHDLERFSEDLSFCLYNHAKDVDCSFHIRAAEKIIRTFCMPVHIDITEKYSESGREPSSEKSDRLELHLCFNLDEKMLHRKETITIQIELDRTQFRHHKTLSAFRSEYLPYHVQLCDMPTLLADNIHAILCRNGNPGQVDGRDLFNFVSFSSRKSPVNMQYLQEKLVHSGYIARDAPLALTMLQAFLKEKWHNIDYREARKDVDHLSFIPYFTNAWTCEFFCFLARNLKADAPEVQSLRTIRS